MLVKYLRTLVAYFVGWPGLTLVLVATFVATLNNDAKRFTELSNQQSIEDLLTEHTLKAPEYAFYYRPDGKAFGSVGHTFDVGTWEAHDAVYCEQWRIWGEGLRRCWTLAIQGDRVKRTGTGFPFNENDPPVNEFQRVEGNRVYSQ